MTPLRWWTAGDSHGPFLMGVLEGLPAGWTIRLDKAQEFLAERSAGFGRSHRQKWEKDKVEVHGGVYKGKTTGAPLLLLLENAGEKEPLADACWVARPGHGDLSGFLRTGQPPEAQAERGSARESAMRTALGGVASALLEDLGEIEIESWSLSIGAVHTTGKNQNPSANSLRWPDSSTEALAIDAIKMAGREGTTLGGSVQIEARGLPGGWGESSQPADRLSVLLGGALLSIPSVRAVSLGKGLTQASMKGSGAHDDPLGEGNMAGGIEGGRTNGKPIRATLWAKPISTQRTPLPSVNLQTGQSIPAPHLRSDVCVVGAIGVIAKALTGLVLAQAGASFLGGGHWEAWKERYEAHRDATPDWLP
ncbi:chorismate synthase [bacterium]|nr:chorismate synthase [bacterium]